MVRLVVPAVVQAVVAALLPEAVVVSLQEVVVDLVVAAAVVGRRAHQLKSWVSVFVWVCKTYAPRSCVRLAFGAALGLFMHPCEEEMICKSTHEKVPYFNAAIYLENKTQIGKVDEIFGPINNMVRARCVSSDSTCCSCIANAGTIESVVCLLDPLCRSCWCYWPPLALVAWLF